MGEFRMPSLGADMEAGTLVEWRVRPGDTVKRGDIVASVDTSKAEIDVEIFEDGIVEELLVPKGTRVPVGTVLATIRGEAAAPAGGTAPAAPQPGAATGPAEEPPVAAFEEAAPVEAAAVAAKAPDVPGARIAASPLARRVAGELGVPLDAVRGSGPGGAVLAGDVEAARAGGAAAPARTDAQAVDGGRAEARGAAGERAAPNRSAAMREAIAAAMARSKREIPHYYLGTSIDVEPALTWLAAHNAELPVARRVLPAALMLRAVALAAREVPELNGFWIDGAFRPAPAVHLGVAIALRTGGLVAPAIHDADRLDVDALMRALRDLVGRARAGGLRSSELTDATLTVTNLGDSGVATVFGVIYPPQVALVGFGAVSERPWAAGGMVGARRVMDATLAADHRASDGHQGAALLTAIDRLLHDPERL
jgi:pyruvate dehydrogenase E2 component (dihydrolipoamide acetyltransferase)